MSLRSTKRVLVVPLILGAGFVVVGTALMLYTIYSLADYYWLGYIMVLGGSGFLGYGIFGRRFRR